MPITESFKMAIKSIWSNKMRSFLTMLGIIIGVAAVIILVSVVNGYMSTMIESFTSMGVDRINVSVNNMSSRSLDPDDMYEFFDENYELFENMTPSVNVSMPLKNGNDTMSSTSIGGYSEDYIDIVDYDIAYGRSISYADCEAERSVAVLGYYTALELFDNASDAVGQKIKILSAIPNDSTRIADEHSLVVMDIVIEMEDHSIANVEVQKLGYMFPYLKPEDRIAIVRFINDIPCKPDDPSYESVIEVEHGLWLLREHKMCIIWAVKDWLYPEKYLHKWMNYCPDAKVHRVRNAGRFIAEDAPEELIAIMSGFFGVGE